MIANSKKFQVKLHANPVSDEDKEDVLFYELVCIEHKIGKMIGRRERYHIQRGKLPRRDILMIGAEKDRLAIQQSYGGKWKIVIGAEVKG